MHIIEEWVEVVIAFLNSNIWLGILIAPFLGLAMSFMPCCLVNVGLVVQCVDKDNSNNISDTDSKRTIKKRAFKYSMLFAIGSSVVFFVVGILAGAIGNALSSVEWLFHCIVGVAVISASIYYIQKNVRRKHSCCGHEHMTDGHSHAHDCSDSGCKGSEHSDESSKACCATSDATTNISVAESDNKNDGKNTSDKDDGKEHSDSVQECDCGCACHVPKTTRIRSGLHAFLMGLVGAVFSTPCSIPALLAILAYSSAVGQVWVGVIMILLYAIGHSVLLVVAGTSTTFLRKIKKLEGRSSNKVRIIKIVLLSLLIVFAIYIVYEGFAELLLE